MHAPDLDVDLREEIYGGTDNRSSINSVVKLSHCPKSWVQRLTKGTQSEQRCVQCLGVVDVMNITQ